MRHSRIQKAIDWWCFAVFLYGIVFAVIPVLLSDGSSFDYEIVKVLFGLAIVSSWLAVVITTLAFIFSTALWVIGKAPWYWKTLSPVNFSFVLLAVAFLSYNKNDGYAIPILIVLGSFAAASLIVATKVNERKWFLLVFLTGVFCFTGYYIPLFLGSLLLP
jgi:hypothetical protein